METPDAGHAESGGAARGVRYPTQDAAKRAVVGAIPERPLRKIARLRRNAALIPPLRFNQLAAQPAMSGSSNRKSEIMQTLKQWAIAAVGAVAFGGLGMASAPAADVAVQPGPTVYERAVPQYAPAPVEVYPAAPPPVVYRYAPPPPPAVVYYDYPPPVVVYPRRYRYAYGGYHHHRHHHHHGPRIVRGYGHHHHGRHWHRQGRHWHR
jgi:hypothetical protein